MRCFLLCFSFFFVLDCAGNSAHNKNSPFFWTAQKDGKTHHLLGTIHKGINFQDLSCSEAIKDRLQNSRHLFMELDLAPAVEADPSKMEGARSNFKKAFQVKMSARGESAFWKSLTEEQKTLLQQRHELNRQYLLSPENIKEDIKKFNREEVSANLAQFCALTIEQKEPPKLLDVEIYALALQYSIKRSTLETFGDQARVVSGFKELFRNYLTEEAMQESALEGINDFDEFCSNLKSDFQKQNQIISKTAKAYKKGTLDLEDLINNDIQNILSRFAQYNIPSSKKLAFKKDYKKIFTQKLLKERHDKWLPQIVSAHQDYDSFFVAVGLLHLTGEDNILNRLKEAGFEIKRFSCQEK